MRYRDLRPALTAWKNRTNIMSALRDLRGVSSNSDDIVEIAYDLQAGTYTDFVAENPDYWFAYTRELASILEPLVTDGASTLDVGTGELTTLVGVSPAAFSRCRHILACDISFSRVFHGLKFASKKLEGDIYGRVDAFVGSMFELPLSDASVDVVWTSHALEPNGGRELAAVSELLRVTRCWLVLFEPSFEENSDEGRDRMARLGYVRDLPGAVARAGGEVVDRVAIRNVSNPLNPTVALICRPRAELLARPQKDKRDRWACPATRGSLERRSGYFFSAASLLAYPIVEDIPMLRPEHGVLCSILAKQG